MTRLWILSDLHLEQSVWTMPQPPEGVDVIVAAGDIHSPATRSVEWLADNSGGIPVAFVPGNTIGTRTVGRSASTTRPSVYGERRQISVSTC